MPCRPAGLSRDEDTVSRRGCSARPSYPARRRTRRWSSRARRPTPRHQGPQPVRRLAARTPGPVECAVPHRQMTKPFAATTCVSDSSARAGARRSRTRRALAAGWCAGRGNDGRQHHGVRQLLQHTSGLPDRPATSRGSNRRASNGSLRHRVKPRRPSGSPCAQAELQAGLLVERPEQQTICRLLIRRGGDRPRRGRTRSATASSTPLGLRHTTLPRPTRSSLRRTPSTTSGSPARLRPPKTPTTASRSMRPGRTRPGAVPRARSSAPSTRATVPAASSAAACSPA